MTGKRTVVWSPVFFFLSAVLFTMPEPAMSESPAQFSDLSATYQFLVSDRKESGALYTATTGKLRGASLPLSFFDTPDYWGLYVCTGVNFPCVVTDTYNPSSFELSPEPGVVGDLQTERVNIHNGANIYDTATWQIAVMLGHAINGFDNPKKQNAYTLASNQNRLLSEGHSANASKVEADSNRAATHGSVFRYNGHGVDANHAYMFRMIPRSWLSTDPLIGTLYGAWITAKDLPPLNADYQRGKITWTDWKPITGENAWAFLLGPLHAAYLHYVIDKRQAFVPFDELAIQSALAILPTFAIMQSQIGGIYYVPSGTLSNQGKEVANPYQVSVENSISVYAGLKILAATLRAELNNEKTLSKANKATINEALETIDIMINGGKTKAGAATEGLLAFFKTKAWRNNEFIQGGLANDPNQRLPWVPTLEPKAVDTNTWGIAALGAKLIDEWYGFGAAYNNWQQLKTWGAFGVEKKLLGVGYSNQDGNGINADGTYRQGILSAEWTAGAINMVRSMIHYYENIQNESSNSASAKSYVSNLKEDERAMLEGIQTLRFDNYRKAAFPGKPDNYARLMNQSSSAYVYASKRYLIPFGWYANPIPSTCSTAWIIMLADRYDPFGYAGKMN